MGRFGIGRGPVGDSGLCSWHNGGDPLEAQLQYTTVLQHTGEGILGGDSMKSVLY